MLSRYRCLDCTTQFWVISRKTYIVAASLVTATVVAVIAVFLLEMLLTPSTSSPAKRPRRSDGGQQERVLVAADTRFMPRQGAGAARAPPDVARDTVWRRLPP